MLEAILQLIEAYGLLIVFLNVLVEQTRAGLSHRSGYSRVRPLAGGIKA